MKIVPEGTRSRQLKLLYEMREREEKKLKQAQEQIDKLDLRILRIGENKSAL